MTSAPRGLAARLHDGQRVGLEAGRGEAVNSSDRL